MKLWRDTRPELPLRLMASDNAGGVRVQVEVRALIAHDDRVVVNEEIRQGRPRLSLPGGRVDRWESVEEALVREVKEELGVEVDCGAFLCAFEVVKRFRIQDLNLIFRATLKDPGDAAGLRFVDPAENGVTVFPPILESNGVLAAERSAGSWLGNVWDDELRISAHHE